MHSFRWWTGALALYVVSIGQALAGLVTNSSFESPDLTGLGFCTTFTAPLCPSVPGWTGNFFLTSNGNSIDGAIAPIDGSQYLMLRSSDSFTQMVTLPSAGTYTLTWLDAGRGAGVFNENGNESFSVLFNGNVLAFVTTATNSAWISHSVPISSGAGTFALTFQGTSGSGVHDAFIDNIQVEPPAGASAPEPTTLALLGISFPILIYFAFRRRSIDPCADLHRMR